MESARLRSRSIAINGTIPEPPPTTCFLRRLAADRGIALALELSTGGMEHGVGLVLDLLETLRDRAVTQARPDQVLPPSAGVSEEVEVRGRMVPFGQARHMSRIGRSGEAMGKSTGQARTGRRRERQGNS